VKSIGGIEGAVAPHTVVTKGWAYFNMLRTLVNTLDTLSEWSGRIFGWLVLPLIFAITYDVAARYLFSAPTIWSYDLSYMLGGGFMVLGGAYALLHGAHVRVDIIYARLSGRAQLILDSALTILLFFPMMLILLYFSIYAAWNAVVTGEVSSIGVWEPIMWPFRWTIVVAVSLFLLQGISWLIRNLISLNGEGR